jgi:hypothetical protein
VTSTSLTSGESFLGLANPTVTVTPPAGGGVARASVTCTLTVGSNTNSRTITVATPGGTATGSASIPLQLTGTGGTEGVTCASSSPDTTAPAVSVTSAVNAIQIQ